MGTTGRKPAGGTAADGNSMVGDHSPGSVGFENCHSSRLYQRDFASCETVKHLITPLFSKIVQMSPAGSSVP